MKILYISNTNSPLTRVWVNWFAEHGHEVAVIADTPIQDKWTGVKVFDFPKRLNIRVVRYLFWTIWTRQIINNWQPDILHAHRVSSAGWVGSFSGFHPFVVTPWGSDLLLHPNRSAIARILATIVLRSADLITVDAMNLEQKAIELGANPKICNIIKWGADLNIFHPGEIKKIREELGVGDSLVVLSPRGVKPIYNLDIIIESIPLVIKSIPNVIYFIKDYNTDLEYKDKLLKRINQLGINNSIKWLPFQEVKQFADIVRISDAVLSVPSSDSMPISVMEAVACGAPVIVSDISSLHEIITNNINGMIVPIKDAKALATATVELLKNSDKRKSFANYNIEWSKLHVNRDTEMQKMEQLYKDLLNSKD